MQLERKPYLKPYYTELLSHSPTISREQTKPKDTLSLQDGAFGNYYGIQ